MENENVVEKSLAILSRPGYGEKGTEELRIELCSYRGKRYLSLRVWWETPDGSMAPSKKGITVRMGEVTKVISALQEGEDLGYNANKDAQAAPGRPAPQKRQVKATGIRPDGTIADEDVFS